MTNKDRMRASRVAKMWRMHKGGRTPTDVETVADAGVDNSEKELAVEVVEELADDPGAPVCWHIYGVVKLDTSGSRDLEDWVRTFIVDHADENMVPWDLR